jgi:Ice-binding-like
MMAKTGVLFATAAATILLLAVPVRPASAIAVDLGAASNWAILEIGSGLVSSNIGPGGLVVGDVGIAAGQLNQTLSAIDGNVYLGSGATYNLGFLSSVTGSILYNQNLTQSVSAANAASAAASALNVGSPSSISLTNGSMILTPGVYDLSNLSLTNSVLTLSGSGDYTFNDSGVMQLSGSQISLANGATAANVLFNVTGNQVSEASSIVEGTILAPNASVLISSSYVVGEVIGGGNITLAPGAVVGSTHGAPGPIVGTGLPGFALLGGGFLLIWRLRRRADGEQSTALTTT